MKKCVEITTFIIVVLCFVSLRQVYGQSYHSPKRQSLVSKVPRISAKLAYFKYKTGLVIIADAMNSRTYAKYHILGAINLPGDGEKDLKRIQRARLPIAKNREILVYCD